MIFAFTLGIIISNTLSCIVGLIVVIGYVIIYLIKNKDVKKLAIILTIIFVTAFGMHKFKMTTYGMWNSIYKLYIL